MSSFHRRKLLKLLTGTLALPAGLELTNRTAHATPTLPERLLIMVHRHGKLPHAWIPADVPSGSLSPSPLMEPIVPWRHRLAVAQGIDNRIPYLYRNAHLHAVADATLLTANLPAKEISYGRFYSQGPSIDQVIARHLSSPTINLAIGSQEGSPITNTHFLFDHSGRPLSSIADPRIAFSQLLNPSSIPSDPEVLNVVQQQLTALQGWVSSADKERLQDHQDRLSDLSARLQQSCSTTEPNFANSYDFRHDDHLSSPAQIEIMVEALSCGAAQVGTLIFDNLYEAAFHWLTEDGSLLADPSRYRSWADMIHYGGEIQEPLLEKGFQWYFEQLALLLELLADREGPDGQKLLDTTTVLWLSEFGDGWSHTPYDLPVVVAGAAQGATGQHFNLRRSAMQEGPNEYTTNDLFLSLLHSFGSTSSSFGFLDPEQSYVGGIPGLF